MSRNKIDPVNIIRNHFYRNLMPPILFYEYYEAVYKWHIGHRLSDDDLTAVIACGSYWGALLRVTYLQYVHHAGLPAWAYWDAVIQVFRFGSIWKDCWNAVLAKSRVKRLVQKHMHPEWIRVGLVGCGWRRLKRMCVEFCRQIDELSAKEAAEW